ncbi:MAG: hypothetical protein QOJ07_2008 [Thermoleophilaceae bacterium]|nr:hypothetical protein [Thermoleophilaceae bacterium]
MTTGTATSSVAKHYAIKRIEDMESLFHGAFRRAGAELGVESFGMQVFDLPADSLDHPEHDHTHDGQEEVYVVLSGSAEIVVDGERVPLDPDRLVRVTAQGARKVVAGPDGVRMLAIGGTPGKVYERPGDFELGAPDPTAAASRDGER